MTDLEDARHRWIQERPQYEDFANILVARLKEVVSSLSIWASVQHRTKELDSLLKKLMLGKHTFDTLPDKVGIRVLVRYRGDLDIVRNAVVGAFHCGLVDEKVPGVNVVGYQSTHIDWVRLPSGHPEGSRFLTNRFWAEMQIRTQAQHLWSEMSHDGFYKSDATLNALSNDVRRRVNLMAGQIEIADREFDRLRVERPVVEEAELFRFLEPLYYRLTSRRPDSELSLQVLKILRPLFNSSLSEVEAELTTFFKDREAFLAERYQQAQEPDAVSASPLFFQPEAIVLYERLLKDELSLRKAWNMHFPEPILETFANEMGRSFD